MKTEKKATKPTKSAKPAKPAEAKIKIKMKGTPAKVAEGLKAITKK